MGETLALGMMREPWHLCTLRNAGDAGIGCSPVGSSLPHPARTVHAAIAIALEAFDTMALKVMPEREESLNVQWRATASGYSSWQPEGDAFGRQLFQVPFNVGS